jgi:hypothetical protein
VLRIVFHYRFLLNRISLKPQNRKTAKPQNRKTAKPQNRKTAKPQTKHKKNQRINETFST